MARCLFHLGGAAPGAGPAAECAAAAGTRTGTERRGQPAAARHDEASTTSWRATLALSFVFAATWFISTAMAAHLPRLLQAAGATLATAVLVGALIGPAQVGARLLEFGLLRKVHPLLSARIAAALHPLGVVMLAVFGAPAAAVFGVLHGAGNGILTIAKGTLPLVIFGPHGYGRRQGVLMVPARIAQALSPWLFGIALDRWGAGALVISATLGALALLRCSRSRARHRARRSPRRGRHAPDRGRPAARRRRGQSQDQMRRNHTGARSGRGR